MALESEGSFKRRSAEPTRRPGCRLTLQVGTSVDSVHPSGVHSLEYRSRVHNSCSHETELGKERGHAGGHTCATARRGLAQQRLPACGASQRLLWPQPLWTGTSSALLPPELWAPEKTMPAGIGAKCSCGWCPTPQRLGASLFLCGHSMAQPGVLRPHTHRRREERHWGPGVGPTLSSSTAIPGTWSAPTWAPQPARRAELHGTATCRAPGEGQGGERGAALWP